MADETIIEVCGACIYRNKSGRCFNNVAVDHVPENSDPTKFPEKLIVTELLDRGYAKPDEFCFKPRRKVRYNYL